MFGALTAEERALVRRLPRAPACLRPTQVAEWRTGPRGWLVLAGQVRRALPPGEERAAAQPWRNGRRVALSAGRRARAPDRAGRVDGALVLLAAWDADRAIQEVGPLAARLSDARRTVMAAGPVLVRVAARTLADRTCDREERVGAVGMLAAVGNERPELRDACVAALGAALAPEATAAVEDEYVAAYAAQGLLVMQAREALAALRAAFARDAVSPDIVSVRDLAATFGPGAADGLPQQPSPGLVLLCSVCGRVRRHAVRQLALAANLTVPTPDPAGSRPARMRYPDAVGAAERAALEETWSESAEAAERAEALRYGPFLLPEPVVCPHCGAENRYRVCEATLSDLESAGGTGERPRPLTRNARVVSGVGQAHPAVVALRYGRIADAHPERPDWRLRQARSLRIAGRWAQAAEAMETLLRDYPVAPAEALLEAAHSLAFLATVLRDAETLRRAARQGLALARGPAAGEPDAADCAEDWRRWASRRAPSSAPWIGGATSPRGG